MSLHILESKSTELFMARLTEVERCKIRLATQPMLESLVYTHFPSDMITADQLADVAIKLRAAFAEYTQRPRWWEKQTWNH